MPFSCHNVKLYTPEYVDGRLLPGDQYLIASHLSECEACTSYFEQVSSLRGTLHSLPEPAVPQDLQMKLRVIASREMATMQATQGSRWRAVWQHWRFRLNELMRPLALPATGGLLSSLVLFGTFILTICTTTRIVTYEVPLNASRSEANLVPVELRSHAVILTMSFDANGRMADYAIADPSCKYSADLQAQSSSISMPSMPTVFAVAQPISGDIQIKFLPLAFRQ
jgi:hypothetical protein